MTLHTMKLLWSSEEVSHIDMQYEEVSHIDMLIAAA